MEENEAELASMWLDEMIGDHMTIDEKIEQLKAEREAAIGTEHEAEELEFFDDAILRLQRMRHA